MSIIMNEGRNKKLLVPVIALILCAAALIGAGYAAYVSSARNTDNIIEGDIITVSLNEGETSAGAIAKGLKISYGQMELNGVDTFYTAQEALVGYGTLSVDLNAYSGEKIKISSMVSDPIFEGTSTLDGQFSLEVRFVDGPGADYFVPTYDDDDKTLEYSFEIYAVFEGDVVVGNDTVDTNGNKITNPVLLGENTTAKDLIDGFKYSVKFTVYPEYAEDDGNGDSP